MYRRTHVDNFNYHMWIDKEGDRIMISSDAELAEAVKLLDDNILRLALTGMAELKHSNNKKKKKRRIFN